MTNRKVFARYAGVMVAVAGALAAPARAQEDDEIITPGGVLPSSAAGTYNPGDQLAANLKVLAQNPRNVAALTQAGASALAAGDASAALGFLARADEINPSSPRIKQLLGSSLVQLERPEDALRLFDESASIGGLNRDILRDRGLAFDLRGDPRRAQADYADVLRRGFDDEITRRYALSLGATGDREQALRLLDPLTRKQDQAAWRARAFVLAMTGDLRSAERIVSEVMPPGMAGTLGSFMRRLPSLTPAQRAAAVNFGTMPADGPQYAVASLSEPLRPITAQAAQTLTRPAPVQVAVVQTVAPRREKPSKRDRRRRDKDREEQFALARPVVAAPVALLPAPARIIPTNERPGFTPAAPVVQPPPVAPPPPAVPPPVTPPSAPRASLSDNRQGNRVGVRIGAVDPALLPSQARPVAPALAVPVVAPLALPPASVSAPRPIVSDVAPATPPVPTTPQPLFEIPSTRVVPLAPPPVQVVVVKPPVVAPAPSLPGATPVARPSMVEAGIAASPPLPSPAVTATAIQAPGDVVAVGLPAQSPAPSNVSLVTPLPTASVVREISLAGPPPSTSAVAIAPSSAPIPVAPIATATAAAETAPAPATERPRGLADVIETIEKEEEGSAGKILTDEEFRRARLTAKRKADAEEATRTAKDKEKTETERAAAEKAKQKAAEEEEKRLVAKRNPARIWVQIATGANKSGLPGTWRKLKEQGGEAIKGQSAASIPFRATNRLVVGPYKSQAEARAAVNRLAAKGIQATTYTSEPGQDVSSVGGK